MIRPNDVAAIEADSDMVAEVLPPLPIEQYAVQAAVALTEVEMKTRSLLWLMQNSPRHPNVGAIFNEIDQAFLRAYRAHINHVEVLTCKGRA